MRKNMLQSINEFQPENECLLLGGSGFLGLHLLRVLIDHNAQITCMIHKRPLEKGKIHSKKKIRLVEGSITNYPWQSFQENPPTIIFHLARISGRRSLGRMIAANRSYHANKGLTDWILKSEHDIKLVYLSGSLSYGSRDERVTESTRLVPESYSKQYLRGEFPIYRALNLNEEFPLIICKPGWIYGSGSWFERFYLKPMKSSGFVPLYGEGNNWMSLIHVADCAEMVYWIASQKKRGIYNLFIGKPIRQKDFSSMISELSGLPIKRFSNLYVRWRYGGAVKEAFNFSLKIDTNHSEFYRKYQPIYPSLRQGISQVLGQYGIISS
ncbi:MAG: NAD-dependent epimerase/dehydratase family protein [Candidatus Heimdallarchaeota archaeon]